jgi:hypothetical protein
VAVDVRALTEEEIREMADGYCQKNGFKLIDMKKLPHEGDFYLRYVIAHGENAQEYATWLFNVECGGLHYGHYFMYRYNKTQSEAYQEALEYFENY